MSTPEVPQAPQREVTPMDTKASWWHIVIFESKLSPERVEMLREKAYEKGWTTHKFVWEEAPTTGAKHCHITMHTPTRPRKREVVNHFEKSADVQKTVKVPIASIIYGQKNKEGEVQPAMISTMKFVSSLMDLWKLWYEYSGDWIDTASEEWCVPDWCSVSSPIDLFDRFVSMAIRDGYHGIEGFASNSQVRKTVKLYSVSVLLRARDGNNRATDRADRAEIEN